MAASKPPLRLGIVGAPRGTRLLAGLRATGVAELAGVYDPSPEARKRFRRESEVPLICDSFDRLLEGVDAVIVSSPQQYHVPQAAQALRAGVHVLSEVPAAVSMEQVHELLAAVRRSPALYMLAENYCYARPNLIVRSMVAEGAGHGGADTWPIREFVRAATEGSAPPLDIYAALDMNLPGLVSEQSIAQGGAWLAVPDRAT